LPFSSAVPSRIPSVRLLINGAPVAGVISAEVNSNNYFGADCFNLTLATGEAPPLSTAAFWASSLNVATEVQFSLDGTNYQPLVVGLVDNIVFDPLAGRVQITGRDNTATLIESSLEENFSNRTSSEIVQIIAAEHGFGCSTTPTSTLVGRYYQDEHNQLSLDQFSHITTEWDLLVFLSRQEDFNLFFVGNILVFLPVGSDTHNQAYFPSDLISLRLDRSLLLSRDIEVTIRSWNSRQQTSFSQSLSGSASAGVETAGPIRYQFVRPNLTPDQLTSLATRKIAELACHERCVEIEIPGELALTPRDQLTIAGTGTAFDQTYQIQAIRRRIHRQTGFTEQIRATSMAPRTITVLNSSLQGAD